MPQKMMKNIFKLVFLLAFVQAANGVLARETVQVVLPDSVQIDMNPVDVRHISDESLQEFRDDDEFDYAVANIPGKNILEMIRDWFADLFRKLFATDIGNVNVVNIIIYTICILAAAYAIYKLIEMKSRKIIASQKEGDLPYGIDEENIHEMDFDRLIREATDHRQYRRAIRLTYLYALKKLADARKITWEPGKTNQEYLMELNDKSLKDGFSTLSYYFDYAWYGEFDVNEKHLTRVTDTFNDWKNHIN